MVIASNLFFVVELKFPVRRISHQLLLFDFRDQHEMSYRGGDRGGRGRGAPRGGGFGSRGGGMLLCQWSGKVLIMAGRGGFQQSYGPPAAVLGTRLLGNGHKGNANHSTQKWAHFYMLQKEKWSANPVT